MEYVFNPGGAWGALEELCRDKSHGTQLPRCAAQHRLMMAGACGHSGLGAQDLTPMSLGLSHSLSRYKLKFSPDKVRPPC